MPAASYAGYLLQTGEGTQLRFGAGAKLPELGPHGPEPYLFGEVFEVE